MSVKPIPDGFHTLTPMMIAESVPRLIEFLEAAFGATELHRFEAQDGHIMHAQIQIGDSRLMIGEAMEGYPATSTTLYIYVPDADATYKSALDAGGQSVMEPANQFWGDRAACIGDSSGNKWWIATHVEDVEPEELARRVKAQKW
jgi:PhnB protein